MRNGVDKSERNEINRAILLPVRQPIRSETNIRRSLDALQQKRFKLLEPLFEQTQRAFDWRGCRHVHACRL